MPYISEEGKVTLLDSKRRHGLSTNAVAAIACVEPSTGLLHGKERGTVDTRPGEDPGRHLAGHGAALFYADRRGLLGKG